jgi:hypothetical protein
MVLPITQHAWQRQWRSSIAVIAVVVDSGGGGIEPTVSMAASLMVAVVDGGSNDGVFTTTSHDNDCHPHPHHPRPHPPLDEDWTAGWRAHRGASQLLSPGLSSLAPSLSPLARGRRQGQEGIVPISMAGKRWDTTTPLAWSIKKKNKKKQKQQQWRQRHRLCACSQLRPCCRHCCLCVSRGSSSGGSSVAVAAPDLLRV